MNLRAQVGIIGALAAGFISAPAAAVELIVNGGFEASASQTATPTGWTNIGHQEGVIAYSLFATPAYQGNYYYDFGGFGNSGGPAGDGIQQTVATSIGTLYTLTFGLSAEDYAGTSILNVLFNGVQSATFSQTSTGLQFKKPFVTQTVSFLATSTSTTISFIEGLGSNGGNGSNDPLLDGVSFQAAATGAVPEPATWAMMMLGFGSMGYAMRRRPKAARIRFA